MGRNPVIGRQGPAYHAAELPPVSVAKVAVTQVRSEIGHAETMRRTLRALGLRRHQRTVVLPNDPGVRGMIYKVRHLVEVTAAEEK